MTRRSILLSASLVLAVAGSAQAEKLSLPIGEWGHLSSHGLACSPPFLKFEKDRVIKRLGGGEGRCPVQKIKREGKALIVDVKCQYDKSIPEDYMAGGDDDDDSFSLVIKSTTQILFNNSPHGLCPSGGGGGK
ncbi:hypothetical protein LNAOJCKE_4899 [Methylorubrum aminovorans]|uniref:DUF3617 family protein n=1 Tax=Methylorubrum aminovorans TaxID=269069 RepID=A0ABQ4UKJ2_9HYPH|nr:hypothetical protein [Methylorubrum aminovorans]GJE67667.1 hypothetical protein LNAOJCKE_4899 [Methylorubrum aminovorans]GMA79973.1 hypothetical protein GCM10025880_63900 [Methylorubrum aminovorans]